LGPDPFVTALGSYADYIDEIEGGQAVPLAHVGLDARGDDTGQRGAVAAPDGRDGVS
jgi:hypothetical protein